MKTLYVLFLPVIPGARKFCENVENCEFERSSLLSKLSYELNIENNYTLMEMTDFMDAFNNDNMTSSDVFISYLYIS